MEQYSNSEGDNSSQITLHDSTLDYLNNILFNDNSNLSPNSRAIVEINPSTKVNPLFPETNVSKLFPFMSYSNFINALV